MENKNEIIYSNIQTKGETLLVCGGGICNSVPQDLCTLNPTNTCWKYNTGQTDAGNTGLTCPEVSQALVGSDNNHTYAIVCCDTIGLIWGFSQTFLDENNLSQYNGTGYGDCRQLMLLYSPVEDGDYCDRLNLPYTFPPNCP